MSEKNLLKKMLDSFSKNDKYLKTIKEISKSRDKPYKYVSENEKDKILSMDLLCENMHQNLKKHYNNTPKHSSVDGLHYIKTNGQLKLFFMEFKHINLSNKKAYAKTIEDLKIKLKLKALETLSCIFPHLIDKYSQKDEDKNKIMRSLIESKKYYFVVYKDISQTNKSNLYKDLNKDLISLKRLSKHPFEKIYIVDPHSFEKIMQSLT